jgi:hypothetical protein
MTTGGYFWTTGHLTVTNSTSRSYGYMLKHTPTGATACRYRRKSDALRRIRELAENRYIPPETPRPRTTRKGSDDHAKSE